MDCNLDHGSPESSDPSLLCNWRNEASQVGQTGQERLGSTASQSLTGTDRSCTWPRTPSPRSSPLCRCRTQAQTAPLIPFKL